MRLLKENAVLKALNESLSESEYEEYAGYLYDEADGEVDSIPSYEETNDYIFGVEKKDYNKIYKMTKTAIENVADNFYTDDKTYIELSDRATLNNIDVSIPEGKEEDSQIAYQELVNQGFEKFQEETGVEAWQAGRSGRHIVVEDNFYNAYHYNELCDAQEKWENWVIDEMEKAYPVDGLNESAEEGNKLKVVFKAVGEDPVVKEIDDTLEAKQELVGGYIEVAPYKDGLVLICNEEGKIMGQKPNVRLDYDLIVGDFFIVGDDFENAGFKSVEDGQVDEIINDLKERSVSQEELTEAIIMGKLIDGDMTVKELDDTAQWLYDQDRNEWDKFTDNEIKELAKLCQITDKNPGGRAYDDEVFDEMDKRGLKLSEEDKKDALEGIVDNDDGSNRQPEVVGLDTITESDKPEIAGWIAFYGDKKVEISKDEAKDLWGAKQIAIQKLNIPKSKQSLVSVEPAYNEEDLDDAPVSNAQFESAEPKVRIAKNIEWETDGDKEALKELPKWEEIPDDLAEDEVADYLSDKYGWLINGLSIEYIDKNKDMNKLKESSPESKKDPRRAKLVTVLNLDDDKDYMVKYTLTCKECHKDYELEDMFSGALIKEIVKNFTEEGEADPYKLNNVFDSNISSHCEWCGSEDTRITDLELFTKDGGWTDYYSRDFFIGSEDEELDEEVTISGTTEVSNENGVPKKVKDYLDYELEDDNTATGGTAFAGEKVRDFIGDTDIKDDDDIDTLNKALVSCGIKPITESEKYDDAYRGDDYWELSDAYISGNIDKDELYASLKDMYSHLSTAKKAYEEITGAKDIPKTSDTDIVEITISQVDELINDWDKDPSKVDKGRYLAKDKDNRYIAVDNRSGECFVEEFDTREAAMDYLNDKELKESDSEKKREEIMCSFIADLFKNMAEDFPSNSESLYDWCEGGDAFFNAGYDEDTCNRLTEMLKNLNPLVGKVIEELYASYGDQDLNEMEEITIPKEIVDKVNAEYEKEKPAIKKEIKKEFDRLVKNFKANGIDEEKMKELPIYKAYQDAMEDPDNIWCECEEDTTENYKPDGATYLGVDKHGYICSNCKKYKQIG